MRFNQASLGSMSVAVETVRIEGLDAVLRRLKALGPEASKRGGPVRAAVRKGAMVIVKEAQANIRRIVAEPNASGEDESTGILEKSIKPFRAKAKAGEKGETYIVTAKRGVKYPSDGGKPVTATINGQRLEYGTSRRRPMPWMRPAFHAKGGEAVKVMKDETLRGIERLERKLAAK